MSNLEKAKKEKCTPLIFIRTLLMKIILQKSIFCLVKKKLGDGQVAIRYKMRFHAIWQWSQIIMLERSIFLMWTFKKGIFLILHP